MILEYLSNWLNTYVVHFGAWVTFASACHIYKTGVTETENLGKVFRNILIISSILSLFSSHSHMHYMKYFLE